MTVSDEELIRLTGVEGLAPQAAFLERHRIAYSLRLDGSIELQRSELERFERLLAELRERFEQSRAEDSRGGELAARATFMAPQEIEALCGLTQSSAQASWLKQRGYKFERRVDGKIALQRAEVDYHTLTGARAERPKERTEPDWDALLSLSSRGSKWSGHRK